MNKKLLIGIILAVLVGGLIGATALKKRRRGTPVGMHTVARQDVVSRVSATGRIEARRKVDISANVMGQIVNLAVQEGDRVEKGQFLLQIDQAQLEAQTAGSEAALAALMADRDAARANRVQAELEHERARKNHAEAIIPKAELDRARSAFDSARASLASVERRIEQARAVLDASRDSLSKTTIRAPIEGLVTALPVEEGEIAVIGTMNNPGTKLMTISDMGVVQADMEVDETDIPRVAVGHKAHVTIDALPERRFEGQVAEIGSSPIERSPGGNQAVEFSVKIVLEAPPDDLRPGFSCSAEVETGERHGVIAIPVQALVIQDIAEKFAAHEERQKAGTVDTGKESDGTQSDVQGVFRIVDSKVAFVPIETGLQGDLVVEVTGGLSEGDSIVTGPFRALRTLEDGDHVRAEEKRDGQSKDR